MKGQRSHLGLTDELLQTCNLRPDLVLFADKVMDALGQLLLGRRKQDQGSPKHAARIISEIKFGFIRSHSRTLDSKDVHQQLSQNQTD